MNRNCIKIFLNNLFLRTSIPKINALECYQSVLDKEGRIHLFGKKITGNKDEKLKSRWDKVFKKGTSKVFERLSSTYFTWNTMIHCSLQILYFVQ